MRIPVRIRTYNKPCGSVPNVCCPHCGQTTAFQKVKNKTTGYVMFVPTTTITNSTYLVCSACGKAYPVFKKGFDRIDSPAKVGEALRAQEQAQEQTRETYQEAGFSPKNQTVAVILALLLTTLGAPFFYIGKPLWGILCLVVSFLCIASGLFPLYSAIAVAGVVFAVLLGAGKVKDKDGRYIVSSRQREALQQTGSSARM